MWAGFELTLGVAGLAVFCQELASEIFLSLAESVSGS